MRIAFFDLDGTLLTHNSAEAWIREQRSAGHIGRAAALRYALTFLAYRFGLTRVEAIYRSAIAALEGTPEAEIRERTLAFYEKCVRGTYRSGGLEAVTQHRARGDRVVLLTSTSSYIAGLAQRELELDDMICTRFEVREGGRLSGRPIEPICYGEGKLALVRDYLRAWGADLAECVFYSDSLADLPVLEAVGEAVAVHPDPRLRRVARERGWQVALW